MMINKRLIDTVPESRRYVAGNVVLQWCSLIANIVLMGSIAGLLQQLYERNADTADFIRIAVIALAAVSVRFGCTAGASRMGFLSSREVKKKLREMIYRKLLQLGASYKEQVKTSEVVQVAVEGVEQLETYFAAYLPQFFYAMLAPATLFIVLCFVSVPAAIALFVCVPLIPAAIAAVQTWAKKLLAKYWGKYTALGDTFLENLQGLTTLKIYQADEARQEQMNREAGEFRVITMKVLTMQLNSITIMDLVAYGGAALGIFLAVTQYRGGHVSIGGCLMIILLSADFFLPMRQLGSFFHVAMNGMAACDKIFRLLDLPVESTEKKKSANPEESSKSAYRTGKRKTSDREWVVSVQNLHFSYEENREILHGISFEAVPGGMTALVGESGCGKSTAAAVLTGRNRGFSGNVQISGRQLSEIPGEELQKIITYIGFNSYLFCGTVRENLQMGKPDGTDEEFWTVLERVKLAGFLRAEQGLDTKLLEKASNLSGGQRQRLALARGLLHDSPVYVFDEATSSIDVESETDIMEQIRALAKEKTVLVISHRLANVTDAQQICVMDHGTIAETGTHGELLKQNGLYGQLWNTQQSLENLEPERKEELA